MRELPILFGDALVREILADRKTQTRRPVTTLPRSREGMAMHSLRPCLYGAGWSWHDENGNCHNCDWTVRSPFGKAGDRLWVREAWAPVPVFDGPDSDKAKARGDGTGVTYRASWNGNPSGYRWRPSIHMPRWASRLSLDVVDVRVERLQDISEEDAIAEGIQRFTYGEKWGPEHTSHGYGTERLALGAMDTSARNAFGRLWRGVYGAESWDANPWVWAIEFKRVIARAEAA